MPLLKRLTLKRPRLHRPSIGGSMDWRSGSWSRGAGRNSAWALQPKDSICCWDRPEMSIRLRPLPPKTLAVCLGPEAPLLWPGHRQMWLDAAKHILIRADFLGLWLWCFWREIATSFRRSSDWVADRIWAGISGHRIPPKWLCVVAEMPF